MEDVWSAAFETVKWSLFIGPEKEQIASTLAPQIEAESEQVCHAMCSMPAQSP